MNEKYNKKMIQLNNENKIKQMQFQAKTHELEDIINALKNEIKA